jgi:hypothetical protein
MEIERGIKD